MGKFNQMLLFCFKPRFKQKKIMYKQNKELYGIITRNVYQQNKHKIYSNIIFKCVYKRFISFVCFDGKAIDIRTLDTNLEYIGVKELFFGIKCCGRV